MRHKKSGRKFSRTADHRKAMFRNMSRSLLTHERIRTTEAKAKELRGYVEKLITLAKRDDVHSRRLAYKVLENHALVKKLFDDIGPRFAGVPGGFTRVVKMGQLRTGDASPMAVIELTIPAGGTATAPKAAKETPAAAPVPVTPAVPAVQPEAAPAESEATETKE